MEKNYEIQFTYKVEEYGTVTLAAVDENEADEFAREYIRDTYPEALSIEIDNIKEIVLP